MKWLTLVVVFVLLFPTFGLSQPDEKNVTADIAWDKTKVTSATPSKVSGEVSITCYPFRSQTVRINIKKSARYTANLGQTTVDFDGSRCSQDRIPKDWSIAPSTTLVKGEWYYVLYEVVEGGVVHDDYGQTFQVK